MFSGTQRWYNRPAMANPHEPPGSDPQTAADSRHYVTMMFSDLCASTRLGHTHDPEVLDQVLQAVKSAASRVISQHDGIAGFQHG